MVGVSFGLGLMLHVSKFTLKKVCYIHNIIYAVHVQRITDGGK